LRPGRRFPSSAELLDHRRQTDLLQPLVVHLEGAGPWRREALELFDHTRAPLGRILANVLALNRRKDKIGLLWIIRANRHIHTESSPFGIHRAGPPKVLFVESPGPHVLDERALVLQRSVQQPVFEHDLVVQHRRRLARVTGSGLSGPRNSSTLERRGK
jgi:hypothetical protein